jgi:hypothetical protein
MASYQIKITVAASRLPDPILGRPVDPIADSVMDAMEKMSQIIPPSAHGAPMAPYCRNGGLTLGKEITIHAESFDELAKALGQFDALAEQIECANPSKKW